MPLALKASWEVRAGVILGVPVPEYTKRWIYTSADYEKDQAITQPQEHPIFAKIRAEAMDYYLQISGPRLNNWAELTSTWY